VTVQRDWLGLKNELPRGRQLTLIFLSFLAPLGLWSAVSYIPWLWHPLVRVTTPGDVEYFVEDMEVPRADFEREFNLHIRQRETKTNFLAHAECIQRRSSADASACRGSERCRTRSAGTEHR